MQRPVIEQPFNPVIVAVGTNPVELDAQGSLTKLIDSFVLNLYSTAANSIFLGGSTVTTTTGLEIVPGSLVLFRIDQVRKMYEITMPLRRIQDKLACDDALENFQEQAPFTCFNLANIYAVAAAATNLTLMPFSTQFF